MRPKKNFESLNESGVENTIVGTERNVKKPVWIIIGEKRKLIRECPRCNCFILYSSEEAYDRANTRKKVCVSCRSKRYNDYSLIRYCPLCNRKMVYTRRDSYNIGVSKNYACKVCFVKKWQVDKYGKKQDTTFYSECKCCGKPKIHRWKNVTPYRIKGLVSKASNRLCRICSGNQRLKILVSGLELKLHDILKKLDIKFTPQYIVENRSFDVYLIDRNILVEADGEFWHGRGKEFDELSDHQKVSRTNDLLKNEIAHRNNIKLIRIWESEMSEEKVKTELNLL